jgi:hypothetical protein
VFYYFTGKAFITLPSKPTIALIDVCPLVPIVDPRSVTT